MSKIKNKKVYAVMNEYCHVIGAYTTKIKACVKQITEYVDYFDPIDFHGWDEEFEEWRQNALCYLKHCSQSKSGYNTIFRLAEYEKLIENKYLHLMLKENWYRGIPAQECICSSKRQVYAVTDRNRKILLYDAEEEAEIEIIKQIFEHAYRQRQTWIGFGEKQLRWHNEALALLQQPSSKKYERLIRDDALDDLMDDFDGTCRPEEVTIQR